MSRGSPKPHTLTGAAQAEARLTAETWRLEITADPFTEEPHTKVAATLDHPLTLADGSGLQQRIVRLRSIRIGERTMENVMASVSPPRSRALLGQSFLRRLSSWKIDNVRNSIEFEFTGSF